MYVIVKIGRRFVKVLSKSAKSWFEDAVILTGVWRQKNKWQTCQYKTIVNLWYYFPDRRIRDTHNTLKILLDALEDGEIYVNDRWALPRIMDFEIDKKNPRVEIEFEEVKKSKK